MATLVTVALTVLCLALAAFTNNIVLAHGDHYSVYYLDEFCLEYFDEIQGQNTPLTINLRNPESHNPLPTAVITWSRNRYAKRLALVNCSLKIAHSLRVAEKDSNYQFKLNGKVGLNGVSSCKDFVEVLVGEFGEWTRVYRSCDSNKEDFTFTTKNNQILRINAFVSEFAIGLPFEFVITTVRERSDDGCGDLFSCQNALCINKDLKCDHRDNCGDASDEAEKLNCPAIEHDHDEPSENNWLILGLVLGGFFVAFCGIATSIFFIAGRYGKKSKSKHEKEAEEGDPDKQETDVTVPLRELPKKAEEDESEKNSYLVTTPLREIPKEADDVGTNEVNYSESPQMEVEAENPLYESADSSDSNH